MKAALQSPQMRRILAVYAINRLGIWFVIISMSLAVFDRTHSALAVAAILGASQVVPGLAALPIVARLESSVRAHMFAGLYFAEALVTVGLAVLVGNYWLPGILLLIICDGTLSLATTGLLRAQLAQTARENLITGDYVDSYAQQEAAEQKANAATNIIFSVMFVVGPALAGVLVSSLGAPMTLVLAAVSLMLCSIMLIDLHPHIKREKEESVKARLVAAYEHIRLVPALMALIAVETIALFFLQAGEPIEVAYAKVTLHAGDSGFGALTAAFGLGVVVGSVIFERAEKRPIGAVLSVGTLAMCAAYIGLSVAPTMPVACAVAVVGGIGVGLQWAPFISAVQRLTPQALEGRMLVLVESLGALCLAVGLLLGGGLVALSSTRMAFFVIGIGGALASIAFLLIPIKGAATALEEEMREKGKIEPLPQAPRRGSKSGDIFT